MLAILLTSVNFLAGLVLLFESLMVLNQMTKHTPNKLRLAYLFVSVGGFYTVLEPSVTHIAPLALNLSMAYLITTLRINKCDITGVHKALTGV